MSSRIAELSGIMAVVVLTIVPGASGAFSQGQLGGTVKGLGGARPKPGITAEPRIVPIEEFHRLSVADRRDLLLAWSARDPERGGLPLFRLLTAGLQDPDPEVRSAGVTLFRRLDGLLNVAVVGDRPSPIDREAFRSVQSLALTLINHPDPAFRAEISRALVAFAYWNSTTAETPFLQRLRVETHPVVRAALITALGEIARKGSQKARQAVIEALSDVAPAVELSAVNAAGRAKAREAMSLLVAKLDAPRPVLRGAAATAISRLGPEAASVIPRLRRASQSEGNPQVRQEIERAIQRLEHVK